MLQAKALHKTFNPGTVIENHALRGLSLTIDEGEFITVIGSNGAGKSTFLNAISGDLKVDEGQIIIDGQDVTRKTAWQRAAQVARVFQDPMAGTCESLSIEENLALAWQRGQRRHLLRRAVRASQRALFREKLATLGLGLEARLTDRMGLLSGGQRQAVSLLMASLQPSRLLLLDEHTAAKVSAAKERAHQAGITGTPTMFINKAFISGYRDASYVRATIMDQAAQTVS